MNWNSSGSQPQHKSEGMRRIETKLGHDLPVKSVFSENNRDKNAGMPRGHFYRHRCDMHFKSAYRVFREDLHVKDFPLQHEVLLHNKTGMFVYLPPLCTE